MTLETPFNMLVVGLTSSGKTHYLLDLLEKQYKNHFEHVYLICPTFPHNKTYLNWPFVNDEDFIVIPCEHEDVEYELHNVSWLAEGTNSLIILHDCASSQAVKNRTSELVKLGFSARHYGLSTIVITQQLTSIAKPYRENICKLVTFYNPSDKDTNTIFDDYLSTSDLAEKKQRSYYVDPTHTKWLYPRTQNIFLTNACEENLCKSLLVRLPGGEELIFGVASVASVFSTH